MDPIFSGISLRDARVALLDLAMPRRCIVCGRTLALRERFICLDCQADFPYTHYWERTHNPMADRINARIQHHLDHLPPPSPSALPPCPSEPLSCPSELPSCPSEFPHGV